MESRAQALGPLCCSTLWNAKQCGSDGDNSVLWEWVGLCTSGAVSPGWGQGRGPGKGSGKASWSQIHIDWLLKADRRSLCRQSMGYSMPRG